MYADIAADKDHLPRKAFAIAIDNDQVQKKFTSMIKALKSSPHLPVPAQIYLKELETF